MSSRQENEKLLCYLSHGKRWLNHLVYFYNFFLFFHKRVIVLHRGRKKQFAAMDLNSWNTFWLLCFGLLAILIVVGNTLTIWIFLKQKQRKRTSFSNQPVFCWFTCGIVDHPSFYRSIWSIFDNCRHGIPPCWRFHSVSFHLHPWCHFPGEDVCRRLASSS